MPINRRVALVDDDVEFAAACRAEVDLAGFQCEHFETAAAALSAMDWCRSSA